MANKVITILMPTHNGERVQSSLEEMASVSIDDIFNFLRSFGRNTNSFLLAYDECKWFKNTSPPGLIAYIQSGHTYVVAGDPLCAPEDTLAVLQAFSRHVGYQYRIALVLVSYWLIPQLKQAGYGVLKVGEDPFFELGTWKPQGDRAKKVRSAVNLARRLGVTISSYRPAEERHPLLEEELKACAGD